MQFFFLGFFGFFGFFKAGTIPLETKLRGLLLHEKGDIFPFYKSAYSAEILQFDQNNIKEDFVVAISLNLLS